MILIVSNARDLTTDFIILELQRRSASYARLNTENLSKAKVTMGITSPDDWSIDQEGGRIEGATVTAAYFRRPGVPQTNTAISDAGERAYCGAEWSALLKSLYLRLSSKWLNAPSAIALAEDKAHQLVLARALGFDVPETCITNDNGTFVDFLEGPQAIAKPLRYALLEGNEERVIFTSRLEKAVARDRRSIEAAPMILQREVIKDVDVRVTVVGEKVFATAIHSQDYSASEVDWRSGNGAEIRHEPVELPDQVHVRCIQLVKTLGLAFGAIDLIRDQGGRYWFLEINPNGQWAWLESRTGVPIAAALVDALQRKAGNET